MISNLERSATINKNMMCLNVTCNVSYTSYKHVYVCNT